MSARTTLEKTKYSLHAHLTSIAIVYMGISYVPESSHVPFEIEIEVHRKQLVTHRRFLRLRP